MNRIVRKKVLNPTVTLMEVDAPLIAKKAEPGMFIILRTDADGERPVKLQRNATAIFFNEPFDG